MKASFSRGKRSALAWLAIGLLAASGTVPAQTIPGRYIAVLKTGTRDTPGTATALAAQHGLQLDHVYTKALKGFAFAGSERAAQALARRAEVSYVEPEQVYTAFQQTVPTGIRRCDADAVPGLIAGGGLTVDADVAVIDTGLDGAHPDLNVQPQGVRFYTTRKTLKTDANWQDDNGHGTHVGGIIGASDNGLGVVGVAPGARLWPVKVLDSGGGGTASTVIAGIDWVVQRASTFEVANMSLGGSFSQAINDAVKTGTQAGIVFVVAAGNSAWDAANYSPASEPTALTVSALDDNDGLPGGLGGLTAWGEYDDTLAQFSNYGAVVDVCAPGVEVYSTYPVSMGGYATMSGTSMAAPHVAGAAALYIARHGVETKDGAGVEAVCAAVRGSGWPYGHYASFCDLLYYTRVLDTSHEPLLNVAKLLYWNEPAALTFATPADSTKVKGTVPIQITTGASATAVQCYLDGVFIGEDTGVADGWTISWDTTRVPVADGPHMLVAVATDGTSQLAGEAVLVGVNNNRGMKPSVRITQPVYYSSDANPVPVSGVTTLTASAVDLGPVSGVDFYFGQTFIGSGALAGAGEWRALWDTRGVLDGDYTLTAVAKGEDGSEGHSAPIPVAVRNKAIHAGAFTVAKSSGGGQWTATVTYTIHDAAHGPVEGATVFATWTMWTGFGATGPTIGPVSATTDANGQCSLTQVIGKKYYATTFEITSIELSGFTYDAASNDVATRLAINSP